MCVCVLCATTCKQGEKSLPPHTAIVIDCHIENVLCHPGWFNPLMLAQLITLSQKYYHDHHQQKLMYTMTESHHYKLYYCPEFIRTEKMGKEATIKLGHSINGRVYVRVHTNTHSELNKTLYFPFYFIDKMLGWKKLLAFSFSLQCKEK